MAESSQNQNISASGASNPIKVCPGCGRSVDSDWAICPWCGEALG